MLMLIPPAFAFAAIEPAIRTRIDGSVPAIFSDEDYPKGAIRNEEQGTVAIRLEISATGEIVSCSVTESSGSKLLDEATCRIMSERARFVPARDAKGRAVADSFNSRIVWRLPDDGGPPLQTAMRGIINIWEATAAGRQRSCRSELHFDTGDRINVDQCIALDAKFVVAAATYLKARPEEVLTLRLENRWLLDPVLPFDLPATNRGELLARAEGEYRLNDDLSVQSCREGRFTARFNWRMAPCFRTSFVEQVPSVTRDVRMEVQWVVSRGPDTDRPAQLPSFVSADGSRTIPLEVRPRDDGKKGANPLGEDPHQP